MSTRLAAVIVAGTAGYATIILIVDLPEEILFFALYGLVLGLLVGSGWTVLAAGAVIIILIDEGVGDSELLAYVFFVYLPTAVASILAGVACRRLVRRAASDPLNAARRDP